MLFNSFTFLVFFIVVTTLYFILPHKARWSMLLTASCFFYMFFKPVYIFILFATIVVDYYAALFIAQAATPEKKKAFLVISLVSNIGVLALFKYFNFLNYNITGVADVIGYKVHIPYLNILLPIGLSFHTFQAMSYTIEVARGNQKPERHFGIYALYVMFYPQLVAGPIERPQNMLHQFYEKHSFNYDDFISGLKQMLWGIFKKVVVADRLAILVDYVYSDIHKWHGFALLLTGVLYGFQIYCDFSGYSSIAIGSARVMGFRLMQNFDHPLRSKSITEFWRRWHISLYTWFSDYLFNPIVVNRRNWGKWGVVFAILVTFSLSGLWHGANWTFMVWGLLNGIALSYEALTKKQRKKASKNIASFIYNPLSILLTFAFCCFTWIFFRSPNFSTAFYFFQNIFKTDAAGHYFTLAQAAPHGLPAIYFGQPMWRFMYTILLIPLLIVAEHFISNSEELSLSKWPKPMRWAAYYAAIASILMFGVFDTNQFIYFQF